MPTKFDTDKWTNGWHEYRAILDPLRYSPLRILEIGIYRGGSILLFDDYLKHPEAQIVGLDLVVPDLETSPRVTLYPCDQNDSCGLVEIADRHGPFDLIIDDGSHFAAETRNCYETLFPFVRLGGYYSIEDWGASYTADSPGDQRSRGLIEYVVSIQGRLENISEFTIRFVPPTSLALFRKGPRP